MIPILVAFVDTVQCYNIVAHTMTTLTMWAYKAHQSSVMGMLHLIQTMEYYLCTGYVESKSYSGGTEDKKQGMCQKNTVEPWQHIITLLINTQHRRDHRITIYCPISKKKIK